MWSLAFACSNLPSLEFTPVCPVCDMRCSCISAIMITKSNCLGSQKRDLATVKQTWANESPPPPANPSVPIHCEPWTDHHRVHTYIRLATCGIVKRIPAQRLGDPCLFGTWQFKQHHNHPTVPRRVRSNPTPMDVSNVCRAKSFQTKGTCWICTGSSHTINFAVERGVGNR